MSLKGGLTVHDCKEACGEAGSGNDGGAARWEAESGIVAGYIVGEEPSGAFGVEEGVECDEVSVFIYAPDEFVFLIGSGWFRVTGFGNSIVGTKGAPDALFDSGLYSPVWTCDLRPRSQAAVC